MKTGILGLALLTIIALSGWLIFRAHPDVREHPRLAFGTLVSEGGITFEIADTPALRATGLSGRSDIPPDYGMLFVFPEAGLHGFWMKDMLVPLDILWLSDEGIVVGIEEAVLPETYPNVFYPQEPVRSVLEMRAGEASVHGFIVGSRVSLPGP